MRRMLSDLLGAISERRLDILQRHKVQTPVTTRGGPTDIPHEICFFGASAISIWLHFPF